MVVRISDKKKNYSKVTKLLVKPKSYIVLNEKGTTKFYVFNLGTKKKTKQMYYELLEHAH